MMTFPASTPTVPQPAIPVVLSPAASLTEGVWLKGDWHLHTRHSRDSSNNPLSKIIGFAERLGFDYLAFTDHDAHVGGDVANHTWSDPEFGSDKVLLFYGAELTAARGHINTLSAEPYDHQRIFDARDDRDWNILAVKQALGIHISANHPGSAKNPYSFSYDLADSIEIWNSCVWPKNILGLRMWDNVLKSGRMLGARGGSDAHHGVPDTPEQTTRYSVEAAANYVGTPTTWIFAATRSKEAILAALTAGRASISANPYNPRVEFFADIDQDGEMELMMGGNAKPNGGPVTFEVRLVGGGLPGVRHTVRVIKNREEFGVFVTDEATQSLRFTDTPEADLRNYYRVEVLGPQMPYPEVPNSMAPSENMVALSNPIYFNYTADF